MNVKAIRDLILAILGLILIVAILAFYGALGYAMIHFIVKFW